MKTKRSAYPLRMPDEVREKAEAEAHKNRRSLNAEISLLIEEGLRWRAKQMIQATT